MVRKRRKVDTEQKNQGKKVPWKTIKTARVQENEASREKGKEA